MNPQIKSSLSLDFHRHKRMFQIGEGSIKKSLAGVQPPARETKKKQQGGMGQQHLRKHRSDGGAESREGGLRRFRLRGPNGTKGLSSRETPLVDTRNA